MTNPITVVFDPFDPAVDSSSVIETKAMALANDLNPWTVEVNAVAVAMNFNATNATSVTSWTVASSGSQAFVIETGKSYVVGMTVKVASTASGQNWGIGDVTAASSGSVTVTFRAKSGSGTFTAWTISQNAEISTLRTTREARTSNTIIGVADVGKLLDITSGTFTQTFSAAATLGSGFFITICNSSTGDITLDPNASETIDGRTSYIMYPGEIREILCDGSALYSIVLKPFFRRITSTYASMPIPPGYTRFGIRLWSGGASGQRTNSAATLSVGGGGGGCVEVNLPATSFSTTETVTVGAGGAAVTTVANGNVGGDTTFGSLVTAYAGNTWNTGGSAIDGLTETSTGNSETAYAGSSSAAAVMNTIWGGGAASSNASANAVSALYGGGCGGSLTAAAVLRSAGTSTFGGSGGAAVSASNGTAGTQPGGGGGATQTGTQSGAGANGEAWFWGLV